ncbi:hypothetical protein AX768_02770 [Burkholderia sp. PAMC 28687]|uniref:hypothetical protein n=1 Tax=Burkholderia sp. PAMC 28687 TaxID=1795874 RepID=UPI0007833252|nr:hypothetical protein [Burkholderia sp. PAMC 28687]AMM13194.1 hypothetical protein AX768_02770 [Burkholderia sp. PAMC 28687]
MIVFDWMKVKALCSIQERGFVAALHNLFGFPPVVHCLGAGWAMQTEFGISHRWDAEQVVRWLKRCVPGA